MWQHPAMNSLLIMATVGHGSVRISFTSDALRFVTFRNHPLLNFK